jgi:hypothetical protein
MSKNKMKRYQTGMLANLVALTTILSGCASSGRAKPTGAEATAGAEAKLEITYFLGHTHRRFLMEEHASQPTIGESYVDRTLLKKTFIDTARFKSYYARVTDYVSQRRNLSSGPSTVADRECRAPFKILVASNDHDALTLEGCRQEEPASFNRLVDDGEFLIYSSK